MKMGSRQVFLDKPNQNQNDENIMKAITQRNEDVVFPDLPQSKNCTTIMGHSIGPEKTNPCVRLEPTLFNYYKSLSKVEKRRLPARTDPKLPSEIEKHMNSYKVYNYTVDDKEI